jgi:hypothetical protein
LIRSASSTSSLASLNQEKKSSKTKIPSSIHFQKFDPTIRRSPNRYHHHHHQRTVPLRVHHSSDSEEHEKFRHHIHRRKNYSPKITSYSTRSEACQTTNDDPATKNEQEQTDEQFLQEQKNPGQSSSLLTPISSPLPNTSVQPPLDQVKLSFNRPVQQPISLLSSANINNPWPITTSFCKSISVKYAVKTAFSIPLRCLFF